MPLLRGHEVAALLSGFAGLRARLPAEWLEEALSAVAGRARDLGPQDWTVVLHALSRLRDPRLRPAAEALAARLLPRLPRLPLPALVLLAYSAGCAGPSPLGRTLMVRVMELLSAGEAAAAEGEERGGAGRARARVAATRAGAAAVDRVLSAAAVTASASAADARGAQGGQGAGSTPANPDALRRIAVSSLRPEELSALLWAAQRTGMRALPPTFRALMFGCAAHAAHHARPSSPRSPRPPAPPSGPRLVTSARAASLPAGARSCWRPFWRRPSWRPSCGPPAGCACGRRARGGSCCCAVRASWRATCGRASWPWRSRGWRGSGGPQRWCTG
jgi:hypothetical protein